MNIKVDRRNMFYGADSETFETARMLRKNMTLPERILWKKLKDKKVINVKFRRQHPAGFFILDFYCHEYKLAIEIDGEIHLNNEIKQYDLRRTAELERFGIRVIRFTNEEIVTNSTSVIDKILRKITELTPLQGGRGVLKSKSNS